MDENLKIILYADEKVYQNIYQKFTVFDEDLDKELHFFDRNNYDIKHISTNKFINFSINNARGYQNVTHVIIQKSFYRNRDIVKILRRFQNINSNVKVLLYFDDEPDYYEMLLSIIAQEQLCSIAFNYDDIVEWFNNEAQMFNHSDLILKKISKKQRKQFLAN